MTTLLLIRHAAHDALGRSIVGRAPGVRLNRVGAEQAAALARRLAAASAPRVSAVYCSPLERAAETAAPLARALRLEVETRDDLGELDYGEWTGKTLNELGATERWRQFNSYRSGTGIPGGESMVEAQARVVAALDSLRARHPGDDELIAVFSHGDLIRAAIAHYAGIHLDLFQRVEISPASVSVVALGDWGPQLLLLNDTNRWPGA